MRGYVANTDYDWYSFLAARSPLEEVNFWQPSGGSAAFQVIKPGEPFFFRLKAPNNAIAGFGWFARHERMVRSSLAWAAFGVANGAPTLEVMRKRVEHYVRTKDPKAGSDYPVGCLMIAQPVFFPESQWVDDAVDWQRNIVAGKGYDVDSGEGRRIFEACLARAAALDPSVGYAVEARDGADQRYGRPTHVRPRLGQGIFRVALTSAYEGACAVTGEHSWPVLEAAHIQPFGREGRHDVENGLLLRADVHRLFDAGYVTVSPDYRFVVSRRLKDDWENGRAYYKRHGTEIRLPRNQLDRPSPSLLTWHNENVFLG